MIKSFHQFINEQTDLRTKEEELLAMEDEYEDGVFTQETIREAFDAIIAALSETVHKVNAEEKESLDYLLNAGLLTQSEYHRLAAGVEPDKESTIVCLTEWNDADGQHEVVGHPDLETDDFDDLYRLLNKFPSTQIWEDPEWVGSPGANMITLYSIPAQDGGTIKVAAWEGSGWEFVEVFINRSDLTRRIKL